MSSVGLGAHRIAAAVAAGELTATAVLEEHLEALWAAEESLHAWVCIEARAARAAARRIDDGEVPTGALAGVPVGIKDLIDVEGVPTRNGAPRVPASVAPRDATVVSRLRGAGAVVLGKTVTAEYALHAPGPTVNPHDPTRSPGGSSSGSAAAVAAGVVPLGLGTQTAGSVVRPAAYCGVVGAVPTRDRVPRDGITPSAPSMDTVGVLARDVEDAALALGVLADDPDGFGPGLPAARVGFMRGEDWSAIEPGCRGAIEAAMARLAGELDVVEATGPPAFTGLAEAQRIVGAVEVADSRRALVREHGDLLSAATHRAVEAGERLRGHEAAARDAIAAARRALPVLFADVEVVLAPAVLGEAPELGSTGDPLLCRAWTALGVPAVAVDGVLGPGGLPLGVQVVAGPGRDAVALATAARIRSLLTE